MSKGVDSSIVRTCRPNLPPPTFRPNLPPPTSPNLPPQTCRSARAPPPPPIALHDRSSLRLVGSSDSRVMGNALGRA